MSTPGDSLGRRASSERRPPNFAATAVDGAGPPSWPTLPAQLLESLRVTRTSESPCGKIFRRSGWAVLQRFPRDEANAATAKLSWRCSAASMSRPAGAVVVIRPLGQFPPLVLVDDLDKCLHSIECERRRLFNHLARVHLMPRTHDSELSPTRVAHSTAKDRALQP